MAINVPAATLPQLMSYFPIMEYMATVSVFLLFALIYSTDVYTSFQLSLIHIFDSIQSANPSRNLIDTIHEMEAVQDWMISYRKDMGFDVLPIVGSMKGSTDITAIVDKIRADLELDKAWFEKCNNIPNAFNYMRGLLEENGIVVMMNGVVNKNTHRALNVEEFRAFTLVNEWAPLIFINAARCV